MKAVYLTVGTLLMLWPIILTTTLIGGIEVWKTVGLHLLSFAILGTPVALGAFLFRKGLPNDFL